MSLNKLSLAGNNLIIPGQGESAVSCVVVVDAVVPAVVGGPADSGVPAVSCVPTLAEGMTYSKMKLIKTISSNISWKTFSRMT
jgi:hypothetical protein